MSSAVFAPEELEDPDVPDELFELPLLLPEVSLCDLLTTMNDADPVPSSNFAVRSWVPVPSVSRYAGFSLMTTLPDSAV